MLRLTITDMQDKIGIVVTAMIFASFKANAKEATKVGARPKAAPHFVVAVKGRHLCILALNKVNIVAVTTVLVLHVGNGQSEHA